MSHFLHLSTMKELGAGRNRKTEADRVGLAVCHTPVPLSLTGCRRLATFCSVCTHCSHWSVHSAGPCVSFRGKTCSLGNIRMQFCFKHPLLMAVRTERGEMKAPYEGKGELSPAKIKNFSTISNIFSEDFLCVGDI